MALTQGARNKIKSFVQAAKKLLMNEFENQLQQFYGIRPDGTCLLVEELTSRESSVIETARLLRQRLHYLEATIAGENKAPEAVRQLVREQAFTILNRFAALRMSEERNIVRESIRKVYNSEGFMVYDQLTGGAKTAEQFIRYRWYIGHVFDELAIDLPAVFDRFSPYALLFPSERVLLELLAIINEEDLNIYREPGHQSINLWKEDETIGWIYQYYNSREEISAMREASDAPRNSRELAVRNQFFTPRYVVQFLVDNSLGRQWYEMTKGQTALKDFCQYMVKHKMEVFLQKGEASPEAKIDGAHYVDFRAIKDPREILFLDPACGSMHFGLYGFDLFEQIYIEAWDNHPELLGDLRGQYLREDFIKEIPGFILRYNIHGVDIDPRAIQIAGLSLWLRAQRNFDQLNLQPADRPSINKSNLVIAEPLPGDKQLLNEFTKSLPGPIGKLVKVIWDKMQLVGETGLLLKIEEELKKEIEIAKEEYEKFKSGSIQASLFGGEEEQKVAQMAAIYGKGQKISKDFFDTAEQEVLKALKSFAENAEGQNAFQKLLFAEDTARGFAFIELCRKRYDVIVMNPPFGSASVSTEDYLKINYPSFGKNILCCFFIRMKELVVYPDGNISAIFDRTVFEKSSYEEFRKQEFIGKIKSILDTGWGVLDANVETSCIIIQPTERRYSSYLSTYSIDEKSIFIKNEIWKFEKSDGSKIKIVDSIQYLKLPNSVIGVSFDDFEVSVFNKYPSLYENNFIARKGNDFVSFEHYRNYWEIPNNQFYTLLYNGGSYSCFYKPISSVVKSNFSYSYLKSHKSINIRNEQYQYKKGVGYGKFGEFLDAHILRSGMMFTSEGLAISDIDDEDSLKILSFLNSNIARYFLNLYSGLHKQVGYVNLLPFGNHILDHCNISEIIKIKYYLSTFDETNLDFNGALLALFQKYSSFKELTDFLFKLHKDLKEKYSFCVEKNNKQVENSFNIDIHSNVKYKKFINSIPSDNISELFDFKNKNGLERILLNEISLNIFGLIFKRWNLDKIEHLDYQNLQVSFFDEISLFPKVSKTINTNQKTNFSNEIPFLDSFSLRNKFTETLHDLNSFLAQDFELQIHDFYKDFDNYLKNFNAFFDYHYNRYSKNRRSTPIYWPLATKSNTYIVWVYYSALNDSTLFSIVNDLVYPKIKEIEKEVELLQFSGPPKELNDKKEFLAELENFKEELLRVAQLPYKPNQDDGVLITAAPLHNLFRHPKWKKDTQECWKKLEKGEYDWAHLAYSIWPDRVRKKCIKDLSIAIAHGLEDICEVKPKEKKEKKAKEIKPSSQLKLN